MSLQLQYPLYAEANHLILNNPENDALKKRYPAQ